MKFKITDSAALLIRYEYGMNKGKRSFQFAGFAFK